MNVARLLQIRELRVRVLFRAWPPQKAIRLAGPLLSLPIRIPDSTIVSCGQKPYTFRRAMSTLADSDDESHRDPAKLRKRRSSMSGETHFTRRDSELTKDDLSRENDDLPAGFREQAFRWCTGHIATWNHLEERNLTTTIVRGGLTNLLFKVSVVGEGTESIEPKAVLLRIYGTGTDLFFSRILGEICFVLLSERKFGPRLYGVFTEGRLEEWFQLRTLGPSEMRESKPTAFNIAKRVAQLHCIDMPFDRNPIIFFNCKKWLSKADELASLYLPNIPRPDEPADEDEVDVLTEKSLSEEDVQWLKELYSYDLHGQLYDLEALCLDTIVTPVGFCHNDLQAGNIMADDHHNVRLIDFEYGNYNFLCYDIANHFSEMMFDYQSVQEWPYYALHQDNFPDIAWQREWVRTYLLERYSVQGKATTEVPEEKVKRYLRDINRLVCASHFQWAMWSVIQAGCSTIDFPYLQFGLTRFKEFIRQKERLPELLKEIDGSL